MNAGVEEKDAHTAPKDNIASGLSLGDEFRQKVTQLPPECVATLRQLANNVRNYPDEQKYRNVRAGNGKVVRLLQHPNGASALSMLGFNRPTKDSSDYCFGAGDVDIGQFFVCSEILASL